MTFVFGLQTLQSKDFSKIHQLKGLKPKNNSHMNFLWMLWFDENSISTVHTHIYIWRSSSKVIFNPLTAGPSSIFHPVSRQGRKIERFLSRWLQLGFFWGKHHLWFWSIYFSVLGILVADQLDETTGLHRRSHWELGILNQNFSVFAIFSN